MLTLSSTILARCRQRVSARMRRDWPRRAGTAASTPPRTGFAREFRGVRIAEGYARVLDDERLCLATSCADAKQILSAKLSLRTSSALTLPLRSDGREPARPGKRVWLVDWEYSARTTRRGLAYLSIMANFDPVLDRPPQRLLRAVPRSLETARAELYQGAGRDSCVLWALIQHTAGNRAG